MLLRTHVGAHENLTFALCERSLVAIAPVAGPGRIVSAAPEVATALEYDIEAALEEPDDH